MKNRVLVIFLIGSCILLFSSSIFANVPQFRLHFPISPIKKSSYLPFQGKMLIKLIPEKHIAIYGNESDLLIISETPFMDDETRYRVRATKDGKVTIDYFRDDNLNSEIPLPFTRKMKEENYDKKSIKLELPFVLKNRELKAVYVNDRLEITISYRGDKTWLRKEEERRRRHHRR